MKKVYFLVVTLIMFLIPGVTSIAKNVSLTETNIFNNLNNDEINFDSSKYLDLSYQDGNFYSWNQTDDTNQHVVGIFTNNNQQSYLLDNLGIFWSLDWQIFNFYRISDNIGVAQIAYFQNENKEEFFNRNFFVYLKDNKMTIGSAPILSENPYFVGLKQNDSKYIVSYGLGLDLIEITTQKVKTLIAPNKNSGFMTSFYSVSSESGIFVGSDQYYYLMKNITSTATQTKINLKAPLFHSNNVVSVNEENLIIRDENSNLYFINISQDIVINDWKKKSSAKKIAFLINQDTFILNISEKNSGSEYGAPYLVKTDNWNSLIKINNITSIRDFMILNENSGIFIDKNLTANIFTYQTNDSFNVNKIGTLYSFQFINKSLFFGTVQNRNLLVSQQINKIWGVQKNIHFFSNGNGNLLNTVIRGKEKDIFYQNTYFSDAAVNFSITDRKLVEIVITSKSGTNILRPKQHSASYVFSDFDNYHIVIKFNDNGTIFILEYDVKIRNFPTQDLINIVGSNVITSYVGYAKVGLKDNLYDVKSINQDETFKVNKYDYEYLQYVQLVVYDDDTKNMVVKNVFNLTENSEIKGKNDEIIDKSFFFGLKVVNLLNQENWIYLGFTKNGVQPMVNFWDTDFGKNLMNKALARRYLRAELKDMNSQQIKQLIWISNTWEAREIQGKAIVIIVITVFFVALVSSVFSIGYNIFLNKQIEFTEVEKNKILKNRLDS